MIRARQVLETRLRPNAPDSFAAASYQLAYAAAHRPFQGNLPRQRVMVSAHPHDNLNRTTAWPGPPVCTTRTEERHMRAG